MIRRTVASIIATLAVVSTAAAQNTPTPPPVRPIGPITAVTKDSLAAVAIAVPVGNGRVFVNDISARRVVLFDSALAKPIVVADSNGDAANSYGPRPGQLIRYHGDSVLFVSPASMSMLVIDPQGRIARTMAMPSSGGGPGSAILGNIFGWPGFDAQGRLVYFANRGVQVNQNISRGGGAPAPDASKPRVLEPPDSAALVRFDFGVRRLDTAATIKIAKSRTTIPSFDPGAGTLPSPTMTAFPPQTVDDWAVMPNGEIAVVRGRDYHVDWLGADGKWTSTPRMAFDWERLSDEQKNALLDSAATAQQVFLDSMRARIDRQMQGGAGGNGSAVTADAGTKSAAGGGGATMMVITRDGGGDGGAAGGGPPRRITIPKMVVAKAELSDVPDYRPPFAQGAVRADADGNLWIRTNKVADGRPVYDIVNRKGEVTDRVQLPANRILSGFGRGGVVYMAVLDSASVVHLERARIRQIGMVAGK